MTVRGTIVQRPLHRRFLALLLVALALVLGKLTVFDALAAAQRHEASVSFSFRGAMMSVLFLILGIVVSIAAFVPPNETTAKIGRVLTNQETKRLSRTGWGVALALAAIAMGFALWVQSVIRGYGYDV